MIRIPLFLSNPKRLGIFGKMGSFLYHYFPNLERDIRLLSPDEDPEHYLGRSSLNAFLWSALFSVLILLLVFVIHHDVLLALLLSIVIGSLVFVLFLGIFIVYPSILLKKYAEEIDVQLVYALNDLTMQVSAGSSLIEAIRIVAGSDYGRVSKQFESVLTETMSGKTLEEALSSVAQRNQSEFLRRAFWQLATVTQTGSSIEHALRDLLDSLREYQSNRIRKYSQILNFYILIYFMLAVVIPSLTILLLTIISTFMSGGITIGSLSIPLNWAVLGLSIVYIIAQFVVIEYIRVKRPIN